MPLCMLLRMPHPKVEILAVKLVKKSVKKEIAEAGCWQLYIQRNPMSTAGLRIFCASHGSDA